MNTLPDTAQLRPSPSVYCAVVGDESVLYDDEKGVYFGLNTVAARVWALASEGLGVGQIRAQLLEEFEVEPAQLSEDLTHLVENLVSNHLVSIDLSNAAPT